MYSVKNIAEITHFSEHTVRYYTDQGLVPNVVRDENNHRVYDDKSIDWLKGCKYLKDCGMSIKNIKKYVDLCLEGDDTLPERIEIILKQKEHAEQQVEEAQNRLSYVSNKLDRYYAIQENNLPDSTNPKTWL